MDPHVAARAARRCLRRDFLPAHVAVDAEAWRENNVSNRFVDTIRQYIALTLRAPLRVAFATMTRGRFSPPAPPPGGSERRV